MYLLIRYICSPATASFNFHKMKNKPKLAALALIGSLFFACNKEDANLELTNIAKSSYGNSPTLYYDILSFKDYQQCIDFLETLDATNERYIADYLEANFQLNSNTIGNFTDDELEAIDDKVNQEFDRYKVYKDAEQSLSFTSLRSITEPLEVAYMASGDDDKDPFNIYPYTIAYQTALNPYREIMIGGKIYKDIAGGKTQIVINDGDYKTLLKIRNNENEAYNLPNVTVLYESKGVTCKTTKPNSGYTPYTKNGKTYRLKTYCHIYTWQLNAVTNHYRKWPSGNLTWSIVAMSTGIYGDEIYEQIPCTLTPVVKSKSKPIINWSRQEVSVYSNGGGMFYTPTQKTYSKSFRHNISPSQYISVYAW